MFIYMHSRLDDSESSITVIAARVNDMNSVTDAALACPHYLWKTDSPSTSKCTTSVATLHENTYNTIQYRDQLQKH